ncbi:MAG: N-formylglutamate amidohydrolase [Candidatus Cloacimonetes bacterium]|nr:N-formylglutamate amidohydrolase [Candidatus Cloacimonadota bacterium]
MVADFIFRFDKPLVATAIHNGHNLPGDFAGSLGIDEQTQLREEDPHTEFFTFVAPNRITGRCSRFVVDLNRPWRDAVYRKPEDAWGLPVRRQPVSRAMQVDARIIYDSFYRRTRLMIDELLRVFPRVFVFDIHSYNHRRGGPKATPDDPALNPEIILGASNMPDAMRPLVEHIQGDLLAFDFGGRALDVRVDVKFTGGHFPRWLHSTYRGRVACVSVEFKKIFMDEWSGELNRATRLKLRRALAGTVPGVLSWLKRDAPPISV